MRSNAVGGGGTSLAWVVATMIPLQGYPQASVRGLEV